MFKYFITQSFFYATFSNISFNLLEPDNTYTNQVLKNSSLLRTSLQETEMALFYNLYAWQECQDRNLKFQLQRALQSVQLIESLSIFKTFTESLSIGGKICIMGQAIKHQYNFNYFIITTSNYSSIVEPRVVIIDPWLVSIGISYIFHGVWLSSGVYVAILPTDYQ